MFDVVGETTSDFVKVYDSCANIINQNQREKLFIEKKMCFFSSTDF